VTYFRNSFGSLVMLTAPDPIAMSSKWRSTSYSCNAAGIGIMDQILMVPEGAAAIMSRCQRT
jgi:hypothetical protein